jgi:transcriptional regulator with XRE-family HTH domain
MLTGNENLVSTYATVTVSYWNGDTVRMRKHQRRLSKRQLAEELDISASMLSYELRRGCVRQLDYELREYWSYSTDVAQADVVFLHRKRCVFGVTQKDLPREGKGQKRRHRRVHRTHKAPAGQKKS